MSQDLRALRRRPLFTPLFVPVVLAIVAFMLLGWGLSARTTTTVIIVPAKQAGAPLAGTLRDSGVEAVFAPADMPAAKQLAEALHARAEALGADDDVLARIRAHHDGQTVVVVVSGADVARALSELGARPDEASGRDDMVVVVIPRFGHLAVLPLRLSAAGSS